MDRRAALLNPADGFASSQRYRRNRELECARLSVQHGVGWSSGSRPERALDLSRRRIAG